MIIKWHSREDIVDADYAVRSWRAAVVDNRGVTLDPDPAAVLRQETIILGGDLAFYQHWRRWKKQTEDGDNPSVAVWQEKLGGLL